MTRKSTRLIAGLLACATAAAGLVTGSIAVVAADVEIVYDLDFEDGSTGAWAPSGGATLMVIDDGGDNVLQVADRANDYDGIESPPGLEAGVEYTLSMDVRLAEAGTADMRFVARPGFVWVGNTTITEAWTTISGTYTPGEQSSVYIGSGSHSTEGDAYTYFVDDVVVTTAAPMSTEVIATDFDDGTSQGWFGRGDAQAAASTDVSRSPDHSLAVTNRADTWQGPGLLLTDQLQPGAEYQVSVWAQLPAGADLADFNLAVVRTVAAGPQYEWISGFQTGIAGEWVELSGAYAFDEADTLELYVEANGLGDFFIDDLSIVETTPPPATGGTVISTDFENGLDDWVPRPAQGTPTITLDADAHQGGFAALIADRSGQGDGIGRDVSDIMEAGVSYEINAWVKMAAGSESGDISVTMRRTNADGDSYDSIAQVAGVTAVEWIEVNANYIMGDAESAFLYFETAFPDGTDAPFLVDDITVSTFEQGEIEDITPIKDTLDPGFGFAIDSRETTGAAGELTARHADQVTPENHMKPEAFYDADRNFVIHPDATAVMDFAAANDMTVYGHVLVWHSQTPEWFFEDDDGRPLTDAPADQEFLLERMRTHIFNVASTFADTYGPYGSDTNPLVAWDVVNEVISDGETPDGMRTSRWYDVLGEEFVDAAYAFADEAFNEVYAADGVDRPVLLAINDYSTEQGAKRARYKALVQRLLDRGAPLDIVGHQFHVSISLPVSALDDALADFAGMPVLQLVSELDVTTGTPVTGALLIDQGYFFQDAFEVFRSYGDSIYSITVWGLTDNRSWRSGEGAPLVFAANFTSKPAYLGIVGAELPARQRSALVFGPSGDDIGVDSTEWDRLPLISVDDLSSFQLRWIDGALVAFVDVVTEATDGEVELVVGDTSFVVARDGSGNVPADLTETDSGFRLVATLPLADPAAGDLVDFDVAITAATTRTAWNSPGATGTLSLVEPLSFTEATRAAVAPIIDGVVDAVWEGGNTVVTELPIQGAADGATAAVTTMWTDDTLYVLADVADATPDVTASNPWEQDSIELFVDVGNAKNGSYRDEDAQIRISSANVVSFGTGDVAAQTARLESATSATERGYIIEAAIDLLYEGAAGSFHGLDIQVNDGADGARRSIRAWADPTGVGYLTTARWGVVQLIDDEPTPTCDRIIEGAQRRLFINEGTTCVQPGATIRGNVVVRNGASLVISDATVKGNLYTFGAADVTVTETEIRGNMRIADVTGSINVVGNSIGGSVFIYRTVADAAPFVSANTIGGRLKCFRNDPAPVDGDIPNMRPDGRTLTCG